MTGPALQAGRWRAVLAPAVGGSIASLSHYGVDILRPAPSGATDATQMACFPMVPYVGRIRGGRFTFDGREHHLPPNFPPAFPHSLHGPGWLTPWRIEALGADAAVLVHDHEGGEAWPWSYRARQDIRLAEDGLHVTLTLTNTDPRPMPAGIGLHPYFPIGPDSRLQFAADAMWLNTPDGLPDRATAPDALIDWTAGAPARTPDGLDHLYEGWTGRATLSGAGGLTVLTADARFLQVFQPAGEAFLCAEPATMRPDVVNSAPTAAAVLSAEESLSLKIRIDAASSPAPSQGG